MIVGTNLFVAAYSTPVTTGTVLKSRGGRFVSLLGLVPLRFSLHRCVVLIATAIAVVVAAAALLLPVGRCSFFFLVFSVLDLFFFSPSPPSCYQSKVLHVDDSRSIRSLMSITKW